MLSNTLDHVPQESFYMVAGIDLWNGLFPYKRPHHQLWASLAGTGFLLLIMLVIKETLNDFAQVNIIIRLMTALMILLAAASVLFSVRPLARRMPCAAGYAVGYGLRCLRASVHFFVTMMTIAVTCDLAVGDEESRFVSAVFIASCVLYMITGFGGHIAIRTRIVRRIKDGRYVYDGDGFWDSPNSIDRIWLLVKCWLGLLAAVVVVHLVGTINDVFDFFYADLQPVVNILALAAVAVAAMALNVIIAYYNAKQDVLVYSWKRFKDSLDGFAPVEEEYNEEDDEDE